MFGHACAPFGIRQVTFLLEKVFNPLPPLLQGMLQLQGPVALYRSPEKCHQRKVEKENGITTKCAPLIYTIVSAHQLSYLPGVFK